MTKLEVLLLLQSLMSDSVDGKGAVKMRLLRSAVDEAVMTEQYGPVTDYVCPRHHRRRARVRPRVGAEMLRCPECSGEMEEVKHA